MLHLANLPCALAGAVKWRARIRSKAITHQSLIALKCFGLADVDPGKVRMGRVEQ